MGPVGPEGRGRRIRLKSAAQIIISTRRLRHQETLREFVASGNTGLDRIVAIDPREPARRILWSAVLVSLVALTVYYVERIIRDRFKFETASTVTMLDGGVIHFPAVTFCNLNLVKKSRLCREFNFSIADSYSEQKKLCGGRLPQKQNLRSLNTLLANEIDITYEDLGHSLQDMLVACFIKGLPCNRSEITEIAQLQGRYGRCYCVFCRTEKQVAFSRTDQPIEGFNMILRTQFEEYISSTSSEGFMVVIHDPRLAPSDSENGIYVAPRRTTYIAIQPTNVFRLGFPYPSSCSDEWSSDKLPAWVDPGAILEDYTPHLCLEICHSDFLNQICVGCVVSGGNISLQAAMDATAFCARNLSCAEVWLEKDTNFECNCPQRCTETTVNYRASLASWIVNGKDNDHLVKISIYFTTITREKISEFPLISDITALTSVGGFLNMYVGLSFLSVYELIEIVLFVCVQYRRRAESRMGSEPAKENSPNTVNEVEEH